MVNDASGAPASIHASAATGFERAVNAYTSGRPTYHPEVIDAVVDAAEPTAGGVVVDLGAGTGIVSEALVERGLKVTAVEPVAGMRAELAKRVPRAQVLEGSAEAIPLADHSVAVVVAATAFHWFDHAAALDEIARVLGPNGSLVTLWNVRDESVPWMAAYTELQVPYEHDTPRYRDMQWRRAIEADDRFGLVTEVLRANPVPSSADHTVARFLSTSFIASLSEPEQRRVEAQLREVVAPLGDTFAYPYRCEAQVWRHSASS